MQWFKATDFFKRGEKDIFVGPIPFDFDKSRIKDLLKEELLISHSKAKKTCLYKIITFESYAIQCLWKGCPVGFTVEEIEIKE